MKYPFKSAKSGGWSCTSFLNYPDSEWNVFVLQLSFEVISWLVFEFHDAAKVAKKSVRSSSGSDNKEFEPHMVFKSVVASLINSFHVPTVPVNRRVPLALSTALLYFPVKSSRFFFLSLSTPWKFSGILLIHTQCKAALLTNNRPLSRCSEAIFFPKHADATLKTNTSRNNK